MEYCTACRYKGGSYITRLTKTACPPRQAKQKYDHATTPSLPNNKEWATPDKNWRQNKIKETETGVVYDLLIAVEIPYSSTK